MLHLPFGVTEHRLSLELELDDGYRLVHFRHQLCRTRQARVVLKVFGLPDRARIVAVYRHGEVSERQQVDAVSFLQRLDVRVADTDAQHGSQ